MKRDRDVRKHDLPPESLDAVGLVLAELARTEPELAQTLRAAFDAGSEVPDPEIAKRLVSLLEGRMGPLRAAAEVAKEAHGDVTRARGVLNTLVGGGDHRVPPELHQLLAEVATRVEPIDAAGLLDATRALAEDLTRGTMPPEHVARAVEGIAQQAAELRAALRSVDAADIERRFTRQSGALGAAAAAQAHEIAALAELRAIDAAAAAGGGAAARKAAAPRIDAAIDREDFTAAARLLEHVAVHEARAGETVEQLQSLQQAATAWARAGELARARETMDAVLETARTNGVAILARSLLSSGQIAEMANDAHRAGSDYEALLALAPEHPEVARWAARASFNLGRVLRFSDPDRAAIALDGARTLSAQVGDAYVYARAAILRAEDLSSADRAGALMILLDARTALARAAPEEAAAVDAAATALGERWGPEAFEAALVEARARRRPAHSE